MVYGYSTERFIERSNSLIEKLEDRNLWNRESLVIALDRSVRMLSYTLKKISDLEKKETPDVRFFNYSYGDYPKLSLDLEKISSHMNNKISSEKLAYKNVIVLDEYVHRGKTFEGIEMILNHYFKGKAPKITFATLRSVREKIKSENELIYVERTPHRDSKRLTSSQTGIENKHLHAMKLCWDEMPIQESACVKNTSYNENILSSLKIGKTQYEKFVHNRKKLSKKIKDYLEK